MMREIFVARTRDEAIKLARPISRRKYKAYHEWGQDKAMPEDDDLGMDFDELLDDRFVFGSVDEVTDQIIAVCCETDWLQPAFLRHSMGRHAA